MSINFTAAISVTGMCAILSFPICAQQVERQGTDPVAIERADKSGAVASRPAKAKKSKRSRAAVGMQKQQHRPSLEGLSNAGQGQHGMGKTLEKAPHSLQHSASVQGLHNGLSENGPCRITATSPPPLDIRYPAGTPEWIEWWDGCFPSGPVGPGVQAGCDLDEAFTKTMYLCEFNCLVHEGLDRESCRTFNWVNHGWIDQQCRIVDAACAHSTGIGMLGWAGVAAIVAIGLTWPDDIDPDQPASSSGSSGSGGVVGTPMDTTPTDGIIDSGQADSVAVDDTASGTDVSILDVLEDASLWSDFDFEDYFDSLGSEDQDIYVDWYEFAEELAEENPEKLASFLDTCSGDGDIYAQGEPSPSCAALGAHANSVETHEDGDDTGLTASDTGQVMDPLGDDDPCSSPIIRC